MLHLKRLCPHLLSLSLLCSKCVIGTEIKISNVEDFKDFASNVNKGTNYSGTTVFLDSDLSLSGKALEPVGADRVNYFLGVFDGQGHIISDLKINTSSSVYTGLFGFSKGLTIRNVVLESSCTITNSYSSSNDIYVGGIIGHCSAYSGQCNIENSVNMADASFSENIGDKKTLRLGGIAGWLSTSNYPIYVKNCANYGSITHSGISKKTYIGGIVGSLSASSYYTYIYNCLNYGTIAHSGTTTSDLYLGGIAGDSYYTYIENCVSAGKMSTQTTASSDNHIGSFVGYVYSNTSINYCYYTSDLNDYDLYGFAYPVPSSSYTLSYDNTTFELDDVVTVGSYAGNSLVGALNAYSDYNLHGYSEWLLNKGKKTVNFTINSRTSPITIDSQVILLPSLASEGGLMFEWYNDSECSNPLESFEITEDKTLYGTFEENTNNYTITFDTRGKNISVTPITAQFGTVVQLPSDVARGYCSVAWWETGSGGNIGFNLTIPAHNFTLYAVWKCTCIETPDDFIDFSKVVNSGTSDSSGSTIYLDSDLSLSDKTLEPIDYFFGIFDGQGHVISDLKINSSSSVCTGLFGYSEGLIIRNVVFDFSCSITSSYSGSNIVYVGGIIGYCTRQCIIESSVNMADVTFSGNTDNKTLYLGGIAGHISSSSYFSYMKNCANYGSVSQPGTSKISYIGGIVGSLSGSNSSYYTFIHNCLNYGTITHNGTTSNDLYLGGITGRSYYAYIDNCVSAGKISSNNITYVGSIAGYVKSGTSINYCYYTSELSDYKMYGDETPITSSYTFSYSNTTFELSDDVSIGNYKGNSLINALNAAPDYYNLRDYSHWLLNKEKKSVVFTINSRTSPIAMDYQIILLPSLASEGNNAFNGWYTDGECTNPLETFEITEDKTLYGRFEENTNYYTITFDTRRRGSFVTPITAQFGSTVIFPSESIREHCGIAFWENEYGEDVGLSLTMPAHNFTLYAVWKCIHIKTPEDFIDFSKVVNSGVTYSGTTVYLDSDLSLSGKTLEPIGKDYIGQFCGTFDGQGYIISDLRISSSSNYTGLFGYSDGLTIRNIVLDSSCSITSSYSGPDFVYIGGIIGECNANYDQCNIENSVNMADVTFDGSINGDRDPLYFGGIAGYLHSSHDFAYMKNCANYGSVTHSGTSKYSYIGGIVGYLSDSSYTYNCLNYGTVMHSVTTSFYLYLGGIAGWSYHTYIENCVSAGKISTQTIPSSSYVGSIVGNVESETRIIYCYYTSDVGGYPINGTGEILNATGTPTTATAVDSSLITNLNSYASDNGWNEWLLNMNNASVRFKVNDYDGFTLNSQVILLPTLAVNNSDGDGSGSSFAFSGWYSDPYCQNLFQPDKVTEGTRLYGVYGVVVTVTFDVNGGNELTATSKKVALNRTYGTLPEANRTECSFNGWFTENNESVTSETIVTTTTSHTLHAQWTINNYTLKFIFNDGTKDDVRVLGFNASIEYPENPTKKGCTFNGWDENITKMPAHNLAITAQWHCKSSSNTGAIVGGVVGGIAGVVIVALLVLLLLLFMKKKNTQKDRVEMKRMGSRIVNKSLSASEADFCDDSTNSDILSEALSKVYSGQYKVPTIAEALRRAGIDEDRIIYAVESCDLVGEHAAKEGKLFDGFSKEDAAAVALYTFDFGREDYDINPYRIINNALVSSSNEEELEKASGLLYLVLSGLRKLPRCTGKTLYRGVREGVDISLYKEGRTVVWHGLSSTSPDMKTTKAFLSKNTASGEAEGTLFVIENGWGYDIQAYSLFSEEEEILLEPERRFRVQSVIDAKLVIINLEMIDTPVVLPEVFGGCGK